MWFLHFILVVIQLRSIQGDSPKEYPQECFMKIPVKLKTTLEADAVCQEGITPLLDEWYHRGHVEFDEQPLDGKRLMIIAKKNQYGVMLEERLTKLMAHWKNYSLTVRDDWDDQYDSKRQRRRRSLLNPAETKKVCSTTHQPEEYNDVKGSFDLLNCDENAALNKLQGDVTESKPKVCAHYDATSGFGYSGIPPLCPTTTTTTQISIPDCVRHKGIIFRDESGQRLPCQTPVSTTPLPPTTTTSVLTSEEEMPPADDPMTK
jgi:hypothetical protein